MTLHSYPESYFKCETEPNNIPPNKPGAKLDAGKTRTGLMVSGFSLALDRVAKVTTFGAAKYTPNGWVSVPSATERYTDALYRHLLANNNSPLDPDSGLEHLAHAAWNILAILELKLRKELSESHSS